MKKIVAIVLRERKEETSILDIVIEYLQKKYIFKLDRYSKNYILNKNIYIHIWTWTSRDERGKRNPSVPCCLFRVGNFCHS